VACFDEVSRPSTPLAQRVARNTHTILGDECNLNQVIDPAGGSYSVEWLTNQLAEESWKFFQELETAGGMTAALEAGIPQQRVEEVADKKIQSLGKRKAVLVGTNMFPNPGEVLLESEERELEAEFEARDAEIEAQLTTRDVEGINEIINRIDASDDDGLAPLLQEVFLKGLTLSEIEDVLSAEERISVDPIFVQRLAEDFEELRMSVDELDCSTIFQANIGPSRAYRARADWTSAFFQVGGFTVEGARDFDNVDDAIKAAKKMNAKFVVLTSSDKTYKDCVPAFARKFKTTTPDGWLLVAGAPGESEKTWREAGVDDFVHVRINNYEMLNSLLEKMEVKS
jgi:methylmalonyl-CoA mutase